MVLFVLFIAFVALIGRALWLQGLSTEFLQKQGESRYARTLELPATRGKITDRNGQVLASSLPVKAVWAIPEDVLEAPDDKLRELARLPTSATWLSCLSIVAAWTIGPFFVLESHAREATGRFFAIVAAIALLVMILALAGPFVFLLALLAVALAAASMASPSSLR